MKPDFQMLRLLWERGPGAILGALVGLWFSVPFPVGEQVNLSYETYQNELGGTWDHSAYLAGDYWTTVIVVCGVCAIIGFSLWELIRPHLPWQFPES